MYLCHVIRSGLLLLCKQCVNNVFGYVNNVIDLTVILLFQIVTDVVQIVDDIQIWPEDIIQQNSSAYVAVAATLYHSL